MKQRRDWFEELDWFIARNIPIIAPIVLFVLLAVGYWIREWWRG